MCHVRTINRFLDFNSQQPSDQNVPKKTIFQWSGPIRSLNSHVIPDGASHPCLLRGKAENHLLQICSFLLNVTLRRQEKLGVSFPLLQITARWDVLSFPCNSKTVEFTTRRVWDMQTHCETTDNTPRNVTESIFLFGAWQVIVRSIWSTLPWRGYGCHQLLFCKRRTQSLEHWKMDKKAILLVRRYGPDK